MKFEGMSRDDLDSLKGTPVGTFDRFGGHLMLRWEESSPLTRIIADGRPEGGGRDSRVLDAGHAQPRRAGERAQGRSEALAGP